MDELLEEVRLLRVARRESRILPTAQDQNDSATPPPYGASVSKPEAAAAALPSITVAPPSAERPPPPVPFSVAETTSQLELSPSGAQTSSNRMTTFAVCY